MARSKGVSGQPREAHSRRSFNTMQVDFKIVHLKKRFPLRISRGVMSEADNLFVSVTSDDIQGWGEMAPGSAAAESAASARDALAHFCEQDLDELSVRQIYDLGMQARLAPCALAALDMAIWDVLAKKAGLPLYQVLGGSKPTVPTSVTIGINTAEVVRERIPMMLEGTGVRSLKVKLGSPEGIDADKSMFAQVVEVARNYNVSLRVDANGGWNLLDAKHMLAWLADRGTDYVEQPLAEGNESELPSLFHDRPLPIYVDESCRVASDILGFAKCVDGVNLKLMKCGGITGALQIIEVARACGLKLMIGCMGESSISISAGAALTGMLDHVDLDSHLNLSPDPCEGVALVDGIITPSDVPGHGGRLKDGQN